MKEGTRVEYLFQFFDSMDDEELRAELASEHLKPSGTRAQMLRRLRDHYRASLIEIRKIHRTRTADFYNYFIVIDFECSCEENNYDFEHEIIEFPALLVSVDSRKIIDSFRTIVRPGGRPKLTEFCKNLTGISQEMVDKAPTFPDALRLFRRWMAKHGLDGRRGGGKARRFCFVTDGPWDVAKFLQMQCHQSAIPIPHDFRAFLNIRRAFVNFYCHQGRGKELHKLPGIDLKTMLQHLGMEFEGREHRGIDDTRNIARILVRMLQDGAELRVNEKMVRGTKLRDWQKLIFDESKKAPSCPASSSSSLSPSHPEERGKNISVDDVVVADTEAQIANYFEQKLKLSNDAGRDGMVQQQRQQSNGTAEMIIWKKWWDELPYKLVRISRIDFLGERHTECESCDEDDE